MKLKVQMVQENKKERRDIVSKVVESFDDLRDCDFGDIVYFSDKREEVVLYNYPREGKCMTCSEIKEEYDTKMRRNIYLSDRDLDSPDVRDFYFHEDSSELEKNLYLFLRDIFDSSFENYSRK